MILLIFAIIIAIMSTLAIIYSNGYLKPYIEKGKNVTAHCLFLIMLMASMLGVVACQNALMFLIIWELNLKMIKSGDGSPLLTIC